MSAPHGTLHHLKVLISNRHGETCPTRILMLVSYVVVLGVWSACSLHNWKPEDISVGVTGLLTSISALKGAQDFIETRRTPPPPPAPAPSA